MRLWRFAAVLSISILALVMAVGFFIYSNRKDLSFLFSKEDHSAADRQVKKDFPSTAAEIPPAVVAKPAAVAQNKPLSIENIRVLPYDGKNGGFLPVINAVSGLEGAVSAAAKILGAGSPIFPSADDRIDIIPVDASRLSADAPYEIVPGDGGTPARILIPVEQLALRFYPAEELLSSAIAESLLTRKSRTFAESPEFLRHGAALHLSGFGDYFEKRFILRTDRDPAQMVLPLSDASSYAWADGFWDLKALKAARGAEGMESLLNEVISGRDWKSAIESAYGAAFNSFQDHYRAFSVNYLSVLMVNRPRFKKAVQLLRDLNEEEAYPILLDFAKNHPTDLYAGEARYYMSYASYRLGRTQKAADGFIDLLNNSPHSTASQGKAHYFLGRSYELRGFRALAVIEYRLGNLEDNELLRKAAEKRLKELEK